MEQVATVISVNGNRATVKVDRKSMCDGCHKNGCGDGCAMYKIFGAKSEFTSEVLNEAHAVSGDRVIVETSDKSVNAGAFFVFILPIIIATGVYFAAFFLNAEPLRILAAFIAFTVYFVVLALTEKARKKRAPRLVITKIVGADN
ncbi:MAG: SoxR reducing system RseC family protein [Clostridia bacterium]|nr:SoxR reducing system RseC family protein [Clostridia bacterium]